MYQDLILPIIYKSDSQHSIPQSEKNTTLEIELSERLKLLEELIDQRSEGIENTETQTREFLLQEYSSISDQLKALKSSTNAKYKHRIEIHKIPISIKHKSKKSLDEKIIEKSRKIPSPPHCIHFDRASVGKINLTTWKSSPKPSWRAHNFVSELNSTILDHLAIEEAFRPDLRSASVMKIDEKQSKKTKKIKIESKSQASSPDFKLSKERRVISTQTLEEKVEDTSIREPRKNIEKVITYSFVPKKKKLENANQMHNYPQPIVIQSPIHNTMPGFCPLPFHMPGYNQMPFSGNIPFYHQSPYNMPMPFNSNYPLIFAPPPPPGSNFPSPAYP